jgi:hypothetical protein
MEQILEKLETLIDDIYEVLKELKGEIEDYQLRLEEGGDLQWEDLD